MRQEIIKAKYQGRETSGQYSYPENVEEAQRMLGSKLIPILCKGLTLMYQYELRKKLSSTSVKVDRSKLDNLSEEERELVRRILNV